MSWFCDKGKTDTKKRQNYRENESVSDNMDPPEIVPWFRCRWQLSGIPSSLKSPGCWVAQKSRFLSMLGLMQILALSLKDGGGGCNFGRIFCILWAGLCTKPRVVHFYTHSWTFNSTGLLNLLNPKSKEKLKTWLQLTSLPGGVGSPEVTKEAHVLVISLDIDTSCSGRLEKRMNYLQTEREREIGFPLCKIRRIQSR